MEHLNFIVKECIKGLGANQTEKGILRVSRALGTLECTRSVWSSHPSKLNELRKSKVFQNIPSRKHDTFPHPRNVLHGRPRKDMEMNELHLVSQSFAHMSQHST